MKRGVILTTLLILVGISGYLLAGKVKFPSVSQEVGDFGQVPSLTLKDYSGKKVRFADFKDKALVINSWAAWCPFCKKELPDFVLAQKEFGNRILIIAVDRQEPLEIAKKYTDEVGVTDDLIFLLDPQDSFYKSIGGFSMPETIFVSRDGVIKIHKRGPMDLEEIKEKIKKII